MRLLAANHPFVDGNKRTALATAVYFYLWNGLDLEYQEELEAMLVLIAIREDFVNPDVAVEHLDDITEPWEVAEFLEYFDVLEDLAENITERMGQDDDVEE
jgi:death-on-curing protein